VVSTPEEAEALGSELDFPCALKPLAAHRFALHFGVGAKLFVVERREELRAVLERARALDLEMMVTDIVPGPDHQHFSYYSYLDERGEPLFHFTKRKLRQYPTQFGLTCYQVTDWNPEVAELGLRFFQGIGLRGVGNVEFKRDARDGRLKLIECNHRFTAANDLVRHSGLDIPLLAYNRLTGRPGPSMDGYRTGVRMWHPIEDVRALREYRRAGQLTARKWARSLLHRQHFPLVRADDPMPTVANLSRRVGGLARAARGGAPRAEGSGPAAPVVRPG
jgi:predicted ATP-grasp superfamily ATP-dependent carboligase